MNRPIVEIVASMWRFAVLPGFRTSIGSKHLLSEIPGTAHKLPTESTLEKGLPVEIQLAVPLALERDLSLPKINGAKARAMLRYQALAFSDRLDQELVQSEQLISSAADQLMFRQVLARKSDIEAIQQWLQNQQRRLGRVVSISDGKEYVLHQNRTQIYREAWIWWGGVFAISMFVLGASYFQQLELTRQLHVELRQQAAIQQALGERISEAAERGEEQEKKREIFDKVAKTARNGALTPLTLQKLTEILPIHSWLHELSYDGGDLRLDGQIDSGLSELLEVLRRESWVLGAEILESSTPSSGSGGSPFSIALSIDAGGYQ